MVYLDPSQYVSYGLAAETTDDWATMASALIDSHCRRPSLAVTQYTERMRLTAGCMSVKLSYLPLNPLGSATSPLVSINVRFGIPRRGEMPDPMLHQVAFAFSIPGAWSALDPSTVDLNPVTGDVTFPLNFLGLAYNEVEITYTAGVATAPVPVQAACAQIIKNAQAIPALNVRGSRVDTMQMQYFSGSLIDPNVQKMLAPYVAQRMG